MENEHSNFNEYLKMLDEQSKEQPKITIDELKTLAKYGDAYAQNELAIAHMTGDGVPKDLVKAVHFFKKAADQYHVSACVNLALCYADGIGTEKDLSMSIRYIANAQRKAYPMELYNDLIESYFSKKIDITTLLELADQGNAQAQYFAGMCYADGTQLKQDRAKAWDYYVKSAVQGEALALYMIGVYYAEGLGVARDLFRAEEIFTQATMAGSNIAHMHRYAMRGVLLTKSNICL